MTDPDQEMVNAACNAVHKAALQATGGSVQGGSVVALSVAARLAVKGGVPIDEFLDTARAMYVASAMAEALKGTRPAGNA